MGGQGEESSKEEHMKKIGLFFISASSSAKPDITGKSKHFGFIQFEDPEVAEIAAVAMHDYLLLEHMLQVHVILPEHVKPNLCQYKLVDWVQSKQHNNKERTLEEHRKLLHKVVKRDQKRRKRIEAAGIEYQCPQLIGNTQPLPKKIKFTED
uniref:RRM domain-containing protein n=1 Tax=Brassica oleracea var. oleracea TaxID=109376 RepID=A0A0D3AZQ5_BRAOL